MATLTDIAAASSVKLLIIGYPGAAKTGSLVALANAGYKLRVLSFDGNTAPLVQFIKPEFRANVDIIVLQDKLRSGPKGGQIPDGIPSAFAEMNRLLGHWKYKDKNGNEVDLGKPEDWGNDTVLVLDPLSRVSNASKRRIAVLNNRIGKDFRIQDWGDAAEEQENIVEKLCSIHVPCNVVVISHLTMIGPPDKELGKDVTEADKERTAKAIRAIDFRLYPDAVGRKLPPRIAGYFDTVIKAEVSGSKHSPKRVLLTAPELDLDIKVPAVTLPKELPIETGLLTIFEALKGPLKK